MLTFSKAHPDPSDPADAANLAELDNLAYAASLGDRDAIAAIAIAFGGELYDVARKELEEHPEDAVKDFLEAMGGGRVRFHPPLGRPLSYMRAMVRTFARHRQLQNAIRPGEPAMNFTQLDYVYGLHVRSLCQSAYDILGNHDDAEDAVHDAFVEVAEEAADVLVDDSRLLAHIADVVRGLCEQRLRKTLPASGVIRQFGPPTPPTPIVPVTMRAA